MHFIEQEMKQMKKILFLPLLQMQSGHHQVAEALMDALTEHAEGMVIKKMELLSYANKALEKVITNSYLKWIRYAPKTYHLAYKHYFSDPSKTDYFFKGYQFYFIRKMEQLLSEEKPDLIVCTQAFPSYLLSKIKSKQRCEIPIINVYTDFFINSVWGKEGIDAHFLPSREVKEKLSTQITNENLIVTGIPVHEEILKNTVPIKTDGRPKILISGGNCGLGRMLHIARELKKSSHFDFLVLCGKNKRLYEEIHSWNLASIQPFPYLSSRLEISQLYEKADAIITKPGGVTISEALRKKIPIFIHSALPGQEEMNMRYLETQHLVFHLKEGVSLEKQLLYTLYDDIKIKRWEQAMTAYHEGLELKNPKDIVQVIQQLLDGKTDRIQSLFS